MASAQTVNQRVIALGVSIIHRITGHQGEGRDITNPRELYAIIALADAKREQTSLAAPLIVDSSPSPSSEESMNTRIEDCSTKRPRRHRHLSPIRPGHHGSMEMLESYRGNMPAMTLVKHSSSLDDLTKLKQYSNRDTKQDLTTNHERSLFFPEISESKNTVTFKISTTEKPNRRSKNKRKNRLDRREPSSPHIPKQDSEGFSQTCYGSNGYLLQETILARLRLREQKTDKSKPIFPKLEPNKLDLRAYDKYPNQYWELRSESIHQPQDLEIDMIDRERYRLKQKSALKLKVLDEEKPDRRQRDLSPRLQQDDVMMTSPTKRPRQKPRVHSENLSHTEPNEAVPFVELIIGPISENNASVPCTANQDLGLPNSRKVKHYTPYFLTDEEVIKDNPTGSRLEHTTPKADIGTSVVNISMHHDTPKKRNPKHIEQSLVKQQETRQCDVVKDIETSCTCSAPSDENMPQLDTDQAECKEHNRLQDCKARRQYEHKQKALLQGKKIEVFGEHKPNSGPVSANESVPTIANEPKKYMPRCHPPIYKLDMRNYPPQGNVITTNHTNDVDTETRCRSRSVKLVDGMIILKHLGKSDRSQNVTGTTGDNTNENKLESSR